MALGWLCDYETLSPLQYRCPSELVLPVQWARRTYWWLQNLLVSFYSVQSSNFVVKEQPPVLIAHGCRVSHISNSADFWLKNNWDICQCKNSSAKHTEKKRHYQTSLKPNKIVHHRQSTKKKNKILVNSQEDKTHHICVLIINYSPQIWVLK